MASLSRSNSGSQGAFKITAPELKKVDVFYSTSNGMYSGNWHDGTNGTQVGDVPKISDVLGARAVIKKPVRPIQVTAKTILADAIKEERANMQVDKVISADVIHTIQDLCNDKKNTVFVVSGKERHSLIKTLGHIPNLGLAAEHGMYISWPETEKSNSPPGQKKKKKKKRHWDTLVPISDRTWRSLTMSIMEVYASRTHGSYIEETEMKVLWQYRDADPEFGYLQARELEDHLSNVLRNYAVDILHGGAEEGGYVEVRPKGVNKGVFAMKAICYYDKLKDSSSNNNNSSSAMMMSNVSSSGTKDASIDFALVLGDDHCDEPMLSVMRQVGHRVHGGNTSQLPMTMRLVDVSHCDSNVSNDAEIFTCTVGKKPSSAANYLQDVSEVEELLQALVKVSKNPNASKSMLDLMMEMPIEQDTGNNLNSLSRFPSSTNVVAGSLGEFLGGIDDDGVEEDMFF